MKKLFRDIVRVWNCDRDEHCEENGSRQMESEKRQIKIVHNS
jgi:hypothetical protein